MDQLFDVKLACEAQANFQKEKGYPDFAPKSGRCFSCGNNIYSQMDRGSYTTGISVQKASSELITGCPHCNRSFVD